MKFFKTPIFLALILTVNMYSQSKEQKYMDHNLTPMTLISVMAKADFQPVKLTNDVKRFKATTLQLPDNAIKQLNITTWSFCSYKHDEYYEIYNIYYKEISKSFYAEYCKELIALMILDGTVKQSR